MHDTHPVTVTLNAQTTTYSAGFQTKDEHATGWKSVLKAAYGRAEVQCRCRGNGQKRLAIKYLQGQDQYFLARFGSSGNQHARDCQYYAPAPYEGGQSGYALGVIQDLEDGSVKIRLEVGLKRQCGDNTTSPQKPAGPSGPGVERPKMKLLGLLHYLWEAAGLNQWKVGFTGKRSASRAYYFVGRAAASVHIGELNLAECLLLPAHVKGSRDALRNASLSAGCLAKTQRMVLIAPLVKQSSSQEKAMASQLKIGGFHGMPYVAMNTGLWESTMRKFPLAIASWRAGGKIVAIAQIELSAGKERSRARAIDLALMSVTDEYIPVESSYERVVAQKLVLEGRSFWKPLRYDAGDEAMRPDFVLTDTRKEIPMEVFGREDEDYQRRKEEKITYYDGRYGANGWWYWDAAADATSAMRPFPPA